MKLSWVSVGLCAVAGAGADKLNLDRIFRRMTTDPEGAFHIDELGILRSLDRRGKVLDFARLERRQLLGVASAYYSTTEKGELISTWANANSSQLAPDDIWSPAPHLLPRRFTDPGQREELTSPAPSLSRILGRGRADCTTLYCNSFRFCVENGCTWCLAAGRKSRCILEGSAHTPQHTPYNPSNPPKPPFSPPHPQGQAGHHHHHHQ
ncbi:hypothetical protein ACJ72_02147 [Emergomyces africanus]|uniref:Apple domain-containing protein n=1 Tax=Emergomyces africanus TaxID=1955775 RepID=A0A1B7P396_9EURO|nr:hypothetical protein ACJ72_02147 [Emergomyces africanus]